MTVLETLADRLASQTPMPADVRDALALHVVDTVGAWITTAATKEARALTAFRDAQRIATSPADPSLALAINCALTRMSEIDDIHPPSMITPGSIVVPGALSIAASLPNVGADALREAIAAGYDAMVGLGSAIDGASVLYRGIWPTYFAAPFGIAAVSARLLGLNPAQTAHALSLALNMAPPGIGHHGLPTSSRWLAMGLNARNGYSAAKAAQAGFTSDTGVLDGKFFENTFGLTIDTTALSGEPASKLPIVSFKPWCAARQTMASTQALKELIADGLSPADISAVDVFIPPQMQHMIDHGIADGDRLSRLTSVQYQLALAAHEPGGEFHVGQTRPVQPAVSALMRKITVHPDERYGQAYPRTWHARVRVKSGDTWSEREVSHIPGDPARPLTRMQIADKYHRFVGRKIGNDKVDALFAQCDAVLDGRQTPAQLLAAIEEARQAVMAA